MMTLGSFPAQMMISGQSGLPIFEISFWNQYICPILHGDKVFDSFGDAAIMFTSRACSSRWISTSAASISARDKNFRTLNILLLNQDEKSFTVKIIIRF